MLNILGGATTLASRIFRVLSHMSLRGLVLALGIGLMLVSWRPELVNQLDGKLFQLGTWLVETPLGAKGVVVIEVPQADLETWQSDINQAGELGALLSNILDTSDSMVGVVLHRPIDARTATADELLAEIAELPTGDSEVLAKAQELVRRKGFLLEFLRNERVVVGVLNRRFSTNAPYQADWGMLEPIPGFLKSWLWFDDKLKPVELPGSVVNHHPVYRSGLNELVLIDESGSNEAIASFLLQYLHAEQLRAGVSQDQSIWRRDRGVMLGSLEIPASPAGVILPFYGATRRMTPGVEVISFEEAMARGAFPPRVYISGQNSELARHLALAAMSIEDSKFAHSPWWFVPLGKSLILLFTLYLVFLLPRFSRSTGIVLTVFMVFLVLVSQLVAQATQKLWFPLSLQIIWLLLGHVLILVWAIRLKGWRTLLARADDACISQSRSLLQKGELEPASDILEPCTTSNELLAVLYDISSAYASKRQYPQAVKILQTLQGRNKSFRDVKEKIDALQSMVNTGDKKSDSGNGRINVESTVVLDTPQIEKPVLGRYEIREELGRGAMGTVYLAYDPKISRQVAVKTLNYNQFQDQLLEDIKSRFFREAEAAGRLSHPNIVSVFDVGEEHDLAFIAMDFADGKPLNAFATKDTLLPVFEVYRIICDVAQALEYAHNNQIIHRDIKPGNIMYCPSPYQLKVTDFGIARLMDNSKTSTGEILGSPLYMAPEQLKGKKVTPQADIFSLGVTFYQLLTGKLPFEGENLASLTYEIIHGKHKGIRSVRKDLPSSAARIVNQALQKIAGDRYTSAGEMALVLKKAIKRDFAHEARRAGYL